jgi:hypothetical protein
MLNQKKVEIFLVKFRKPPTKQFLEVALKNTMLNTKRDTFELSMQQKIKGIESR